jgi:hypothetical protein
MDDLSFEFTTYSAALHMIETWKTRGILGYAFSDGDDDGDYRWSWGRTSGGYIATFTDPEIYTMAKLAT